MTDGQVIGLSFFGSILIFYFLYLGFRAMFPKPTEYEWRRHMKARRRWIEMMENRHES